MNPPLRFLLLASILAMGVAGALLQLGNELLLEWFCQEDGLLESLSAIFYFLAAGMFVYANHREGYRNIWLWGYALLFLMIAGEEISWGQRLLGIATPPALAAANVQGEVNLHNIQGVHGTIRALSLLVVLGVCYVVPLASRFCSPPRKLLIRLRHPVFPLWAAGIVSLAIVFMIIPRLAAGQQFFGLGEPGRFDELGEFFLAVAFLVFAFDVASPSSNNGVCDR